MQDCDVVDETLPIRQGDVLKRISLNGQNTLVVVVTADCDIANNKVGEAGIACVQLSSLRDYMLNEHARTQARRQLKKRFEKTTEWINRRWLQCDPENLPLSQQRVEEWIAGASPEEIEIALNLPPGEKNSFIRQESEELNSATLLVENPIDHFSGIDALRLLQNRNVSREDQLKTLFNTLDPRELPLDMFFISSIPGELGVGFIAKLRALSFVPLNRIFTSISIAREFDVSWLRVGRLAPTFRHSLAQQFGMLFARIGLPKEYETDREAAFIVVLEQVNDELRNGR